MGPFPGEIDKLRTSNAQSRTQLADFWKRWASEKGYGFVRRVTEETLGLGKGLLTEAVRASKRREIAMAKADAGEDFDIEDLFPPSTNGVLDSMVRTARSKGISEPEIPKLMVKYFADVSSLLEVPKIRIGSILFASLARTAELGKKEPPKSTTDVTFISSYLPYCDALFVDRESAVILEELPRETPEHLRLKEFPAKIFSLKNKEEFLQYLDDLVKAISPEQLAILQDLHGENYGEPFWDIIENEKKDRDENDSN